MENELNSNIRVIKANSNGILKLMKKLKSNIKSNEIIAKIKNTSAVAEMNFHNSTMIYQEIDEINPKKNQSIENFIENFRSKGRELNISNSKSLISSKSDLVTTVLSSVSGKVIEIIAKDSGPVCIDDPILVVELCKHPGFYNDLCISCGEKQKSCINSKISNDEFDENISKGRKLTVNGGHTLVITGTEEKSVSELRINRLLEQKKMTLILDIDHTILHACDSPTSSCPEQYMNASLHYLPLAINSTRVHHHWLKLRPDLEAFLQQVSLLCRISLYTHGTRQYAEGVAGIIDAQKNYFGDRIFSRTDIVDLGHGGKQIDRICLGESNDALIMDDNEVLHYSIYYVLS